MGGGIGAYSDALHPWLPDIKSLIAVAVVGRIPLLGVSLGHQLVAVALGGTVTLNPNGPCRGLLPLRVTDLARLDPLFRHLPDDAQVVHWNDDVVVDLPAGAVALAYAPDGGLSAVRYAATCWGVQGNPEATAEAIEAWALHPSVPGLSPDADLPGLLTTVRAAAERTSTTWRPLLDEFLAQVSRADGGPAESSEPPPTG